MGLKVYWTYFAQSELQHLFDYYVEKSSVSVATKIIDQIIEKTNSLEDFPKIGPLEVLLEGKSQEFRYVLSGNYKIIYWINNAQNRIEIVDVFDTRLNPKKISRKK